MLETLRNFFLKQQEPISEDKNMTKTLREMHLKEVSAQTVRGVIEDHSMVHLLRSFKKLRYILKQLSIPIWIISIPENKVVFVSDKISSLYGIEEKEISVETLSRLVQPEDFTGLSELCSRVDSEGKITLIYRVLLPQGGITWINSTVMAIRNNSGNMIGMVGFIKEANSKEMENVVEHVKYHDPITNLPNLYLGRKLLKQKIEEYNKSEKSFAILKIVLDGFGRIRETFGFLVADEVIKQISLRILDTVNDKGTVYRTSTDEWGVIVDFQDDKKEYGRFAECLLNAIKEPLHINKFVIQITASIGISLYPIDGKDKEELIKHAYVALNYSRKKRFGGFQFYTSSMNIESFKYFQLKNDLRQAIENKEIFIEYQPRIDVRTQKAISAEALIRWKHPRWGEVSPSEFIPIAKETDTYDKISDFVIDSVCRQIGEWESRGISFNHISLNLSAQDFLQETLYNRIVNALEQYKVSPTKLEIEITEDTLLQDSQFVHDQIARLRETGVRLALDDFGTGYSSIYYLKQLPVDTVKIDRSFVQHLPENGEDIIIVQSIIDLSKALNKRVVAEGVETEGQYQLMRQLGCHEIQGYFFSQSISAEEMAKKFLQKNITVKGKMKSVINRRKYFRLQFPLSLSTQMTILSFNNREVSLGSTTVLVQDIGLGGLRFLSSLSLKPHENIVFGFETEILETNVQLTGKIVWHKEKDLKVFEYGVAFTISEHERDKLAPLLNRLTLQLRANPFLQEGNFITQDPIAFLKTM